MVDPFVRMEPAVLRRIGVSLFVVGVTLLLTDVIERTLAIPQRASRILAVLVGAGATYAWWTTPEYAGLVALLGGAVAVLLPVGVCLHVFSELLVVEFE